MNKILLFVFAIILYSCSSPAKLVNQNSINNFYTDGSNVNWERVIEYPNSDSLNIVNWFKTQFTITNDSKNMLVGSARKIILPYKNAGYSNLKVIESISGECDVFFNIEFKENRFKIIVTKIVWYDSISFLVTQYIAVNENLVTELKTIALKNGVFKDKFVKKTSKQLDDILVTLFKPKPLVGKINW